MSRRPVLWWLDPAGRPESRAWLERDLPQGYGLCEVSLEGDWEGPPRSRPVGIVVTATVEAHDRVRSVLTQLKRRSLLPVVVLVDGADAAAQHELMRAGAIAVVKPSWDDGSSEGTRARARLRLARTLELMEEAGARKPSQDTPKQDVDIVAVGSSTGGPDALKMTLCGRGPLRVPVVIAQHVSAGFDTSLAEWLTSQGLPCRVAEEGMVPEAGLALLAPATCDLVLEDGVCRLLESMTAAVPSADRLLASVAREFGRRAVGMVLTGMGSDGAKGLLAMQHAGAFTITQRGDTCIVDGMPASARALSAQCEDWTPQEIHDYLDRLRAVPVS